MSAARITFRVDAVVVDVELSTAQAARLTPVLEAAFHDLASRLQASPVALFRDAGRFVVSELRVAALSADELVGPRGAARLADAFWDQLTGRGALS